MGAAGIDPLTFSLVVGLLALGGVGGGLYAVFGGAFERQARRDKRFAALLPRNPGETGERAAAKLRATQQSAAQKKIKELVDKEREKKKKLFDIEARLKQAGVNATPMRFMGIFCVLGVMVGLVALVLQQPPLAALSSAIAVAAGLPRIVLGQLIQRRRRKFIENFANAVDMLIRSIQSGLPVSEGLKVIASEIPDPVRTEFQLLVDSTSVGLSVEDALDRMYERMPVPEVNFFRTVLVIQKQTGGNLSEALSSLSGILRDRKKLKNKIQALSSEAKTSAMIIGSLPFIVGGGVYLVSPDYIMVLFTDPTGNMILAGALAWMFVGVLVMRGMINFEI